MSQHLDSRKWILVASVSGLLCILTTAKSVKGLEIQFRSLDGFDRYPQAKDSLFEAARAWESHLDDPVTVQLDVRFASPFELGTDGTAFSDIPATELDYSEFRSLLQADRSSLDDETAIQHLPSGPLLSFRTRDSQGNVNIDEGSEVINRRISLTFANARALGLKSFAKGQIDASIAFNELFAITEDFDFDSSDGIEGISFMATAMHEIGHVLGFVSGIDYLDSITLPNGPSAPQDVRSEAVLTSLDFFRYSAESVPLIDVSVGTEAFFSINGGATSLAPFSTGQFNGDGRQAMHWQGDSGIMGALATSGRPTMLTRVDLQAMDVIGWDVIPVPEPSSLLMFSFAVGATVCVQRRQRTSRGK